MVSRGWILVLGVLLGMASANDSVEYEHGVTLPPYSILYKGVLEEPSPDQIQVMMKQVTNEFVHELLKEPVMGVVGATTHVVPLAYQNNHEQDQSKVVYGSFQGDSIWYRVHYNSTVYFTFGSSMLPSVQLTQIWQQEWKKSTTSDAYVRSVVAQLQQQGESNSQLSPFRSISHVSMILDDSSSRDDEESNNNHLNESTPMRGILMTLVAIVMTIPFGLFLYMLYKVFIWGPQQTRLMGDSSPSTPQPEFDKVRQIDTIPEGDLESELSEERFEDDYLKKDQEDDDGML